VLREGRTHRVAGYDALEVAATVRERDGGGRLGRLTLQVAGEAVVYDLASVGAACDIATALRAMTGPRRPSGSPVVPGPRDGEADGAWDAVGSAPDRGSAQSDVTGSPWASPTVAL
jgi:hypothetical protein